MSPPAHFDGLCNHIYIYIYIYMYIYMCVCVSVCECVCVCVISLYSSPYISVSISFFSLYLNHILSIIGTFEFHSLDFIFFLLSLTLTFYPSFSLFFLSNLLFLTLLTPSRSFSSSLSPTLCFFLFFFTFPLIYIYQFLSSLFIKWYSQYQ